MLNFVHIKCQMAIAYEAGSADYTHIGISCNPHHLGLLAEMYDLGWREAERDHLAIRDLLNRQTVSRSAASNVASTGRVTRLRSVFGRTEAPCGAFH